MTHSGLKRFIEAGVDLGSLNLGLSRGSRICLALPNGPEAATCFLALATRCPVAPINLDISEGAAKAQLADLPAAAIVLCRGHGAASNRLEALAATMGIPVIDLVPDPAVAGLFTLVHAAATAGAGADGGAAEAAVPPPTDSIAGAPLGLDDACLLLYTSGTTLRPKRVPLTQRSLCSAALCISETLQLTAADVGLNVMPLYHLHGIMVNVLVSAVSGSAVACTPGWGDASGFFNHAQATKATWYSAVRQLRHCFGFPNFKPECQTLFPPHTRARRVLCFASCPGVSAADIGACTPMVCRISRDLPVQVPAMHLAVVLHAEKVHPL